MPMQRPPQIDMLPDGTIRQPVKPPLTTRLFFWAVVVALIAGGVSIAAFALWIALIILPVALGAAVIAYLTFRFQVWRRRNLMARQPPDLYRR